MTDLKMKAMMESLISSFIAVHAKKHDSGIDKTDLDVRLSVAKVLESAIDSYMPDPNGWPNVKHKMLYDIYLQMRKEEGTITDLDWTRPGMTLAMFADAGEYAEHAHRCAVERSKHPEPERSPKMCSVCGEVKSGDKFKKRGGSKCNACRSKEYRENKKLAGA